MPSLTRVKRAPLVVTVNGVDIKLPTLNLAGLRQLQAWLDKLPSPVDRVAAYAPKLPDILRTEEYAAAAAAMRSWPPKLGSPVAMPYVQTLDGLDLVAQLMVRQGQPGYDQAKVIATAGELDLEDMQGMLGHALGLGGDGKEAGDHDEEAGDPIEAPST
jgi:hypothetical protein